MRGYDSEAPGKRDQRTTCFQRRIDRNLTSTGQGRAGAAGRDMVGVEGRGGKGREEESKGRGGEGRWKMRRWDEIEEKERIKLNDDMEKERQERESVRREG